MLEFLQNFNYISLVILSRIFESYHPKTTYESSFIFFSGDPARIILGIPPGNYKNSFRKFFPESPRNSTTNNFHNYSQAFDDSYYKNASRSYSMNSFKNYPGIIFFLRNCLKIKTQEKELCLRHFVRNFP